MRANGRDRSIRRAGALAGATVVAMIAVGPSAGQAAGRPDLVVASLSRPSSFQVPGSQFTVTTAVKNSGAASAGGSATSFYLSTDRTLGDDTEIGKRSVPALGAKKTAKQSTSLSIPSGTAAGIYYVIACADATRKVKESKEGNNCRAAASPTLIEGSPEAANPLNVDATTAPGATSTTVTADAGGTLSTTGPDGTSYHLTVPADALIEDATITMTPLSSIQGASTEFSFSGGLVGGVDLTPHGLRFYEPATLTITRSGNAPAGTTPVGFMYSESGEEMHLYPWESQGNTVTLELTHFSGGGAGYADGADISQLRSFVPLLDHVEFRSEQSLGELLAQLAAGEITQEQFDEAATAVAIKDFLREIVPQGRQALKDDADEHEARAAVDACFGWGRQMELIGLMDYVNQQFGVAPRALYDECTRLMEQIAKKRFDIAHKRCTTGGKDRSQIENMTFWARFSELTLDGAADTLGNNYATKIRECQGPAEGFTGTIVGHQSLSSASNDYEYAWQMTVTFGKRTGTTGTYDLESGTATVTVEDAPGQTECSILDATEMFTLVPNNESYLGLSTTAGTYQGTIAQHDGLARGKTVTITVDCGSGSGPQERDLKVPDPGSGANLWGAADFLGSPAPTQRPDGSLQGTHSYTQPTLGVVTTWTWNLQPISS